MSKLEVDTIDTKTGTNSLTIKQNDTTAITIDTSQNVGIGTSNPSGKLTVVESSVGDIIQATGPNTTDLRIGNHAFSNGGIYINSQSSGDDLRLQTQGSTRMTIDSSGNVLINKTSQDGAEKFSLNFDRTSQQGMSINNTSSTAPNNATMIEFRYAGTTNGSIGTNGSSTSYNTSSDHRLKENVIDLADATTRVKQLQPKRFNFIADADTTVDGFLAHEVSDIVPEAVTGTHNEVDEEGNPVYQGIDQSKLVPLLTASLQEALTEIDNLKARIEALENV